MNRFFLLAIALFSVLSMSTAFGKSLRGSWWIRHALCVTFD